MERKYLAEFGLNVFTSYKTIIPVEHLDQIDDGHKYHIYFIMSCPKIVIEKDSLFTNENGISLTLKEMKNEEENLLNVSSIKIHPGLDHREIELSTKFPYNFLRIIIKHEDFLIKYKYTSIINIAAQALLNYCRDNEPWEFEVLYIGQSYGESGERTAQQRLASHSTLQKILTDCYSKYPDRQLYVLLLEMTPMLNMTFDGRTKKFSATKTEDDSHFNEVITNLPEYQQVINITEAALINYFKPIYNTCFVENFPNINHKGYQQYFALDYNGLSIELDLEFDGPFPHIVLRSEANSINSSWDFIRYNLFNDPNRKSMYEIFSKESL